jgi:predicted dehydrogenase
MLNIGIIGVSGIAGAHLGAYDRLPEAARVVALCDTIPEKAAQRAEQGVTAYTDYRDLLADPAVDAVSVCTPTFLHSAISAAALRAGKHVLCEKPMALSTAECDVMLAAAAESGRVLMVAHCLRFWPEYQVLKSLVDSGDYGRVQAASFVRLGGLPKWSAGGWMRDSTRSGGAILDLHIHDADYVTFLLGLPQRVTARGVEGPYGLNQVVAAYDYGDGRMITAEGGWYESEHFPFHATFRVALEGATVLMDGARGPLRIFPNDGDVIEPALPAGDGYLNEVADFLRCVAASEQPAIAPPFSSRESIRLIEAEAHSVRTGETVTL